jgi:hypothetical protein
MKKNHPLRESKRYFEILLQKKFDKKGKIIINIDDLKLAYFDGYIWNFQTAQKRHQKLTRQMIKGLEKSKKDIDKEIKRVTSSPP